MERREVVISTPKADSATLVDISSVLQKQTDVRHSLIVNSEV